MIRVSISNLEYVRNYPEQFAKSLLTKPPIQGGGVGMFGQFKNAIYKVHNGDLNITDARNLLLNQYSVYKVSRENKAKQDNLISGYENYFPLLEELGLSYADGMHQIKWSSLHSNVLLSGLTPIVLTDNKEYYCHFYTEHPIDWESELKFPMVQEYIANSTLGCDSQTLNIGLYCLSDSMFFFRKYSKKEIKGAVTETSSLFGKVDTEYTKLKK